MSNLNIQNSLMQKISIFEKEFYIKRDDLLDKRFNGNKARKFYFLLMGDFAHIDTIISYGGAQSNAMVSLANIAKMLNKKFIYYLQYIPPILKKEPAGNFKEALECKMVTKEIGSLKFYEKIEKIKNQIDKNSIFIPQGGAFNLSEIGIKVLAQEIDFFIRYYNIKNPCIITSSGTGTTALFLQKNLDYEVITTPCVGDKKYLIEQFSTLHSGIYPTIIETKKNIRFGKVDSDIYKTYIALKQMGVAFDLLYDSKMWLAVKENIKIFDNKTPIFIHSGGVSGNSTQFLRYKKHFK